MIIFYTTPALILVTTSIASLLIALPSSKRPRSEAALAASLAILVSLSLQRPGRNLGRALGHHIRTILPLPQFWRDVEELSGSLSRILVEEEPLHEENPLSTPPAHHMEVRTFARAPSLRSRHSGSLDDFIHYQYLPHDIPSYTPALSQSSSISSLSSVSSASSLSSCSSSASSGRLGKASKPRRRNRGWVQGQGGDQMYIGRSAGAAAY